MAQAQLLGGDLAATQATLAQALSEHPGAIELRRAQAGVFQRVGRVTEAEVLLRELLDADTGDIASAFTLATMLKEQGRTAAAAAVLRACFGRASRCHDAEPVIRAIELLDDCGRKSDAAAIAAMAIEASPDDARLHAYAGMLQIQLGEFEQARRRYLFALEHDERAWEWHVPIGLASTQRYENGGHPDLALLRRGMQRDALSDKARAELHFALGKAYDDLGDYQQAARHFREGNTIAHRLTKWSRKAWRRTVEARLAAKPITHSREPSAEFIPVFIVGMPRSGTTLLAELLSRYPGVCNRGELPWIARIAERPVLDGEPTHENLQNAAAFYMAHARQDDAAAARWFMDKQPLNFRYVDLIMAMFPQARIIHCHRSTRDTALSLWTQCFLEEVQGYSYDFGDIAIVMRDRDRLMTRWGRAFPVAVHTIRYEQLVTSPQDVMASLATWIGLEAPAANTTDDGAARGGVISTASLWQARQPITSRSVARWRHYAQQIPELLRFSD